MFKKKFLLLFIPLLCSVSSQLSFAQDLNSILSRLVYDANESYESGRSVMLSIEDGEIYTSTKLVPAAADGSNAPKTANAIANNYWGDQSTTTASFEASNPGFASSVPSDINTTALSQAVADLVSPSNATARLLGISTRGPVSKTVGMTGAVAVTGSGTKKVAFMAKGTTMLATDATINVVKDPKIQVLQNDGSGWTVLGENDNHADASASQNISTVSGKEGITLPVGANEAAIVVDVQPGVSYAALVTEQDTTIGNSEVREAIVEAYEITE